MVSDIKLIKMWNFYFSYFPIWRIFDGIEETLLPTVHCDRPCDNVVLSAVREY